MCEVDYLREVIRCNLGDKKVVEVEQDLNDRRIEEYFDSEYWEAQNYLARRKEMIKKLDASKKHTLEVIDYRRNK